MNKLGTTEVLIRLEHFIEEKFGGNKAQFAKALGIEPNQLNCIRSGHDGIGQKQLERFEAVGMDINWLLTGEVKKTKEELLEDAGLGTDDIILIDGNIYMSVSRLADALGVTKSGVRSTIANHWEEITELSQGVNLNRIPFKTKGGSQTGYLLNEQQIYVLAMLTTRSEKAKKFRHAISQLLQLIRKEEFVQVDKIKNEYVHVTEVAEIKKQLGLITEKYIAQKMKIGASRRLRYFVLRGKGLTVKESARALKIPVRTAQTLEKAHALATAPVLDRKLLTETIHTN